MLELFLEFMWPTMLLVGLSTLFSAIIGIVRWASTRAGGEEERSTRASMGVSLVLYSMPEFWLGMLLILLFSATLGLVPDAGRTRRLGADYTGFAAVADVLNHLFLPRLTLTLAYLGEYYLVMRSSLLDVLGEDYITDGTSQGRAGEVGAATPRGSQRAAADDHARRPLVRVRAGRRDHGRVRVRLQGSRAD